MHNCIDCHKEILKQSNKCKSCSQTKHGKTKIKIKCIDCNKKLSDKAFYYDCKRCKSCSHKISLYRH